MRNFVFQMSVCNICNKKQTRSRSLNTATNICSVCIVNIKNNNYVINERDDYIDNTNDENSTNINRCDLSEDITYIDSSGKHLKLNDNTDIPIFNDLPLTPNDISNSNFNSNSNFKDALLASLYRWSFYETS